MLKLMLKTFLLLAALAALTAEAIATPRVVVPNQSEILFTVKEMGVPVSGRFRRFEAFVDIDDTKPERSKAELRIEIRSLTTGNDDADAIAVDANWLDAVHAPYAIYKSSAIRSVSPGRYEAKGALTIRNQTRDLIMQFTSTKQASGNLDVSGEFVINRSDFGIGGGEWHEANVVAKEIAVIVHLVLAPGK
ncbi:MAG: YceI family protein [Betaproteobacteria bacterium]|nr:YceI family protein [Betaproteobacteria bacterium]